MKKNKNFKSCLSQDELASIAKVKTKPKVLRAHSIEIQIGEEVFKMQEPSKNLSAGRFTDHDWDDKNISKRLPEKK